MATVLHEYFHLMALKIFGGKGYIDFSLGIMLFPWDASTTIIQQAPKNPWGLFFFYIMGSLGVIIIYTLLLYYEEDPLKLWALKIIIAPQITWTLTEPLYGMGLLPIFINIYFTYHLLLFSSWIILLSINYLIGYKGKKNYGRYKAINRI